MASAASTPMKARVTPCGGRQMDISVWRRARQPLQASFLQGEAKKIADSRQERAEWQSPFLRARESGVPGWI